MTTRWLLKSGDSFLPKKQPAPYSDDKVSDFKFLSLTRNINYRFLVLAMNVITVKLLRFRSLIL